MDNRIGKLMAALTANRMKPYYVEEPEELHELVRELVKGNKLITSGGSQTLVETGIVELLSTEFKDAYVARSSELSQEENEEIMRRAFVSDTFFTSSNAITEHGELYNIDGNGNRVSAMIFGPKQVIVVAGINKIVKDLNEARKRVETVAAPKNAVRLGISTPCSKSGYCIHCHNEKRMCCSYVTLGQQRIQDRIKVIIVNKELGY